MKLIIVMMILKEDILMSINTIIFSILYIITLAISVYIILTKLFPYLDKKNEIKEDHSPISDAIISGCSS